MTAYRRGIGVDEQLLLAEVLNQSTSASVWRAMLTTQLLQLQCAHGGIFTSEQTRPGPESERAHFSSLPLPLFIFPPSFSERRRSAANIRGTHNPLSKLIIFRSCFHKLHILLIIIKKFEWT